MKSKMLQVAACLISSISTITIITLNPLTATASTVSNQTTSVNAAEALMPAGSLASKPLVLNQTWVDGVPMTSQPEQFPAITSQAAVVMDMTTGTVVYAKNPLVSHYPASITKIMTAMLALSDGHLTDMIPVSKEAADQPPDKLYFVPGEEKSLEQMLYGLLLISANDAAVAIAQKYGGSVAGFADMMNQEAKALGATHTHFVNPNGLPNPVHVTTAYDMALIAEAAMKIPEFRKIVSTRSYNWQGEAWHSHLYNINHMLFTYPGCIGIKTGYTSVAHETLAVAATRGNDTFLAILLDSPTNYSIDHDATQLLNFAFSHYHTQVFAKRDAIVDQVRNSQGNLVPFFASRSVEATVDTNHPIHPSVSLNLRTLPPNTLNMDSSFGTHSPGAQNVPFLQAGREAFTTSSDGTLHVGDVSYSIPGQPIMTIPVYVNRDAFPKQIRVAVAGRRGFDWWRIPEALVVLIIVIGLLRIWRKSRRRRRSRASLLMEATRNRRF